MIDSVITVSFVGYYHLMITATKRKKRSCTSLPLHHHSQKSRFLSLQDLVNPSVVVLDPSSFKERVKGKTGLLNKYTRF